MGKIIKCLILVLIIGVVTACNDNDTNDINDINDSGTSATITPNTGTAHTIAISYPLSNIEDLKNGFYRHHAAVMVTDQGGNAVADGTVVSLNVIDSILARGTIAPADSITGTTLTNALPKLGDEITPTTFPDAYVIRNADYRYIEANDHIMLINADEEDKGRLVAAVPTQVTSIEVTEAYVNSYPNDLFEGVGDDPINDPIDKTSYVVGASLLGAEISGRDASGNLTTGVSATVNGLAEFAITYPININTILSGCYGSPAIDTRAMPAGSADVFVVANVSGTNVTTVSNDFCFFAIDGEFFDAPSHTSISDSVDYYVDLRDGGDSAYLPFVGVGAYVEYTTNTGTLEVVVTQPPYGATDSSGTYRATITVTGGVTDDAATVTFTSGSAVQTVTVTIP